MLARWIRKWDSTILKPLVALMGRWGITPNMLTIAGLVAMIVSGFLLAQGRVLVAAYVVLIGGVLDGLDGELARTIRAETRFGAFFDSVCDHCGDLAVYLGIVSLTMKNGMTTDAVLILTALFGSVFGSHVRSRAASLGIDLKDVGLFTRFERMVVLVAGLFTGWITTALYILAVFNNFSALQRIVYAANVSFAGKHR